jgi:hypothetical protein
MEEQIEHFPHNLEEVCATLASACVTSLKPASHKFKNCGCVMACVYTQGIHGIQQDLGRMQDLIHPVPQQSGKRHSSKKDEVNNPVSSTAK